MKYLSLLLFFAFLLCAIGYGERRIEFISHCPKCGFDNPKEAGGSNKELCVKCRYSLAVYPEDKGPDRVDTGGLSLELKESYQTFSLRCSKCHTLARAINSRKSSNEWKSYVIKMVRKPGSGITLDGGLKILPILAHIQNNHK